MVTNLAKAIAAVVLLIAGTGYAQEPTLNDIVVTNTRDDLLVYFSVQGAFQEGVRKAVLSGVPVSFSFLISLKKARPMWFDRTYAKISVTHTIKYNALKKTFSVARTWQPDDPLETQSFEAARKKMTEIDGLKVASLAILEKGHRYRLRAKAELGKRTLPFYLHYVFFFVSLWDFETDWYDVDFDY